MRLTWRNAEPCDQRRPNLRWPWTSSPTRWMPTRTIRRAHARAVKAGLTAINESKDFVPADVPNDVGINLAPLAALHQTPVLKNCDTTRLSRAEALQRYHPYATQQLAF